MFFPCLKDLCHAFCVVTNLKIVLWKVKDDDVTCYDSIDSYKLSIEYGDFGK